MFGNVARSVATGCVLILAYWSNNRLASAVLLQSHELLELQGDHREMKLQSSQWNKIKSAGPLVWAKNFTESSGTRLPRDDREFSARNGQWCLPDSF